MDWNLETESILFTQCGSKFSIFTYIWSNLYLAEIKYIIKTVLKMPVPLKIAL